MLSLEDCKAPAEITNNASERALRPVVIARKLSTAVQSARQVNS
jgi:hypothetical protein